MNLNISSNNIFSSNWVKLLGIKIDTRRNFELHVSDLFKAEAIELNALPRLKFYLTFEARKILIKSNFNYCNLVWNFTSAKAINKIESVQKGALRFLFDDYKSSYETFLKTAEKNAMMVQRLRYICAEIYKTVNGLNSSYIKSAFKKSDTLRSKQMQHENNLKVPRPNYHEFGTKSLAFFGP